VTIFRIKSTGTIILCELAQIFSLPFQKLNNYNFVIFVATKKRQDKNFVSVAAGSGMDKNVDAGQTSWIHNSD
jgi:hypothetical protein